MINRQINLGVLGTIFIVTCLLAAILGAGALALRGLRPPLNLIRVPGDHATIQAAIDAAAPGDVIQVSAGTYNENLRLDKAVSLSAADFDEINPVNNQTIIDGQGGSATITVGAGLTQMPSVRGFVIRNGSNGIQAGSPFIAEFNYFTGSNIQVNYERDAGGVNRSNVYFQSRNAAIHIDDIGRPLLIENNRIMYAGDDGIEISLQNSAPLPGVVEVNVWNNMIIGSRTDGIQFIDPPGNPQDTNRRFVIMGNLIANSKRAGIGLMPNPSTAEDYSGVDMVEAIRVFNDTFYGNDVGISGGDNLVAFNNIISHSVTRGVWRVQGPAGANAVLAHTLLFNNGADAQETTLGPGIITGQDPLYAAPPNPGPDGAWETVDDDFSGLLLQSTSPAIDEGVTQYVTASGEPVPPSPLTGFTGAAPDLGWREFGSPAFITATPTLVPTMTLEASVTPPSLTGLPTWTAVVVTATPGPATETPVATETMTLIPPTGSPPPVTPTTGITATPASQFTVLSINPNSAQAGTTINLTITGSGFQNGTTVSFEGGQGPAPQVTATQVIDPTTIVISVSTMVDASIGTQVWDVRVTNPDTVYLILTDAFTVTTVQ